MKIAFIDVTVTSSYGGIQTAIWSLAKTLANQGHEISVIGGTGSIQHDLGNRNITVKTFNFKARESIINLGNRFRRFVERWSFAQSAKEYVARENFDWIIITKPYDFFWPFLLPKNSKTKFAFRSGGTSFIFGDKLLSKNITAYFANSYFNAWQIKQHFGIFPTVIYNGVDLEKFGPHRRNENIRKQLGIDERALLCIYAGRLVGWKGVHHTIKAMKEKIINHVPVHFVIIGSGPEESKLKKLVEHESLENKVTFIPGMLHDEIPTWWASADVGIFASISDEGFSNSIAEAMASGLPVIATAFSGNPETVGNENTCGILIPPENSEAIAEAILQLWRAPENRAKMATSARTRIEQNFTWEKVVDRLMHGLEKHASSKNN